MTLEQKKAGSVIAEPAFLTLDSHYHNRVFTPAWAAYVPQG